MMKFTATLGAAVAGVLMLSTALLPSSALADTGAPDAGSPQTSAAPTTPAPTDPGTPTPSSTQSPAPESADPPSSPPTADPASTEAPSDTPASTDPPASSGPASTAKAQVDAASDATMGALWASIDLSRVTLSDGHLTGTSAGSVSGPVATVNQSTRDVFHVSGDVDAGISAAAAYQVVMLGEKSGYWVVPRMVAQGAGSNATCTMYQGNPDAGGTVAGTSPFVCDVSRTQGRPNVRFTFTVSLNRWVESAGVIDTTGPVSLVDGHFESDLPYHVDGTPTVAKNSSTSFSTVMREGDQPINPNLARTLFSYRIVDNDAQTTFWIVGWSANYRGTTKFSREGTCFVVDRDPQGKNAPALDKLPHADVSPYTCTLTGERWTGSSGYGAYEATFTVAKRQMTQVSQPYEQRELVDRVCGASADNCGVSLATVTATMGEGKPVSETVVNPDPTETLHAKKTFTYRSSVTNSGGFKLTSTAGFDAMGEKYEVSLEYNYERSVEASTESSLTMPLDVPPRSMGWIEGQAPLVHTEGTVIVRDGDRYFELVNVSADFPDVSTGHEWVFTPEHKPLASSVGGSEGTPGHTTTGTSTGSSAETSSDTGTTPVTTASTGTLATTGGSATDLIAPALAGVILLGGGTMLVAFTRRRARKNG